MTHHLTAIGSALLLIGALAIIAGTILPNLAAIVAALKGE